MARDTPAAGAAMALLAARGVRKTPSRLAILTVLAGHPQRFLRADDVCRALLQLDKRISVSSTYRLLAHLADLGVIERGRGADGKYRYRCRTGSPATAEIEFVRPDTGARLVLNDAALREHLERVALGHGIEFAPGRITVIAPGAPREP